MGWVKTTSLIFIVLFSVLLGVIWFQADTLFPATTPGGNDPPTKTVLDPDDPGPTFYPADIPAGEKKMLYSNSISQRIEARIDKIRTENDVNRLSTHRTLGSVTRAHSWDMSQHNYMGKEDSEGDSPPDRYALRSFSCEDVHEITFVTSEVVTQEGEPVGVTADTVARGVTKDIFSSDEVREALIDPQYDYIGVGVVLSEQTPPDSEAGVVEVYVTIDLCE